MWLCTSIGFYSIVRKQDGWHVRARLRADLETLQRAADAIVHLPIQVWPGADYRYRIIITTQHGYESVWAVLAQSVDYPNFKGRIASLPDQRDKMPAYHDLHTAGMEWQRDCPSYQVSRLIHGSVDDLKSGLPYVHDRKLLNAALDAAKEEGMKTKAKMIQARLNKLIEV